MTTPEKVYLTTPIYYVNDVPHIGHAYCTLATDTLARFWRKKIGQENVFFLTGTDENSQKTVEAAAKVNQEIYEYLDQMAAQWQKTWDEIGVSYDDFIRTTEERHIKTVQEIFQKIYDKGDIYKGKYIGKYCTGCEAFLKESELDEKGHCPIHRRAPEELEEENYFFRLSNYEEKLREIYQENTEFLLPESRRNEILSFIDSGLEDISVSRETAEFGISLPMDDKHKVYVWFDALINYFSGIHNTDKADFWNYAEHIIGKDITRFHSIIWPAMLLAADIPVAKKVYAHGFFTIDGVKMSKSLGNVISPLQLSEKFGNDALRIGLLGSFEFGNDGDFSQENFQQFYNTKLAGGVGNLFNRVIVLINKFMDGKKSSTGIVTSHQENFEEALRQKKIKTAIEIFFSIVDQANQLLNETEVWSLAKTDTKKASEIFAQLIGYLETLADMSIVLLPESAPKMQAMLGDKTSVGQGAILFQRV